MIFLQRMVIFSESRPSIRQTEIVKSRAHRASESPLEVAASMAVATT